MKTHHLKTWPSEFEAIRDGRKRFEMRANADRDFAVGDELLLQLWDPEMHEGRGGYEFDYSRLVQTGEIVSQRMRVTYILHGGRFGLPPGLCVMSLERVLP